MKNALFAMRYSPTYEPKLKYLESKNLGYWHNGRNLEDMTEEELYDLKATFPTPIDSDDYDIVCSIIDFKVKTRIGEL